MAANVTAVAPDTEIETTNGPGRAPELLSDAPILDSANDFLNFDAYAEAFAALIDSPSVSTPLTVSINAAWGAGKTSLGRLIERLVRAWPEQRGESPHLVVWFNAWMHSAAPNLGTALAAAVGKTAAAHRPVWRRVVQWVPSSMLSPEARQRRRLMVMLAAAVLALGVAYSHHARSLFGISKEQARWAGLGVFAGLPIAAGILASLFCVAQSAAKFVRDPGEQAATGAMGDVGSQFAKLVRAATPGHRRLVIFIDDLDRCSPDRALQVCETASLLLGVPGVITILLGDLSALRSYAVGHLGGAGAGTPATNGNHPGADPYARSFLDKIVQLDFALPHCDRDALYHILAPSVHTQTAASEPTPRTARHARGPVRTALSWLYEHICGRPRRYFAFLAITLVILVVISGIFGSIDNGTASWETTLLSIWFGLTAGAWWVAGIGTFVNSRRRRRKRKQTAQINESLRDAPAASRDTSVEARTQVAKESVPAAPDDLARQLTRRFLIEKKVREGQVELFGRDADDDDRRRFREFIPAVPRAAKRFANRYYLLTSVAVSRNMLGGTPELKPAHLAKWALIMERWPEVADRIIERPGMATELENAADAIANHAPGDPWASLLDGSQIPGFDELVGLLRDDQVRIGSVAERLVFAQPDARWPR